MSIRLDCHGQTLPMDDCRKRFYNTRNYCKADSTKDDFRGMTYSEFGDWRWESTR